MATRIDPIPGAVGFQAWVRKTLEPVGAPSEQRAVAARVLVAVRLCLQGVPESADIFPASLELLKQFTSAAGRPEFGTVRQSAVHQALDELGDFESVFDAAEDLSVALWHVAACLGTRPETLIPLDHEANLKRGQRTGGRNRRDKARKVVKTEAAWAQTAALAVHLEPDVRRTKSAVALALAKRY